ncbi:DUF3048 domain-containing protein [Marmoricola sp. RAF53]|uniref:DUF3048 domain-containing protein n=1 Tax=Marmoricola sp. RAF53 TaxID=3233059 RepID=UPI003F9AF88B
MNSRSTARRTSRYRLSAAVALALVAGLVAAGCGSTKDSGGSGDEPVSQPTQGGTELAAVWPLTGLPAPEQTPDHPVMIVKIDNTYASEPQVGLGKADMVVEELVEGGITRLATLFYSQLPQTAGPVRSMRASDIGVVKPTHAVLVASGAAPPTYGRLNAAKVKYFTEGAPGMVRDHSRHAPYNLFMHLPELAKSLKGQPVVPASYLPWGQDSDFAGVAPATTISAKFSPATTTKFAFNPQTKKYLNTNTHAGRNDQFRADSVLVLRVREGDAGYRDPAGNPVPETLFFGTGNFVLFHNGQAVRGTWTKPKRESPLELSTAAGSLKVPAGHTWIELLPKDVAGGHLSFAP